MPARRRRYVVAIVTSAVAASLAVSACAARTTRQPSGDEPRTLAMGSATPPIATISSELPVVRDAGVTSPATSTSSTPDVPARLAWVNPARCVSPCTYDPQPHLVRVDDRGNADAAGKHLVHGSAEEPLRALVAAARAAGHNVRIESAYRSYDDQARVFRSIAQVGRAARPGHSEHQLGTAIDLRMPTSAAMRWLAEHAADHGFALSYPEHKQRITGYRPEPWHVRFVGNELAAEVRDNGWSMDELFRARPELGESGTCNDCPLEESRTTCGSISSEGTCKGSVLRWCYDGALAAVDCAALKQRCGRARGAADFDCLPRR